MSKYLLIDFNRYETNLSTHTHFDGDSPEDVLTQYMVTRLTHVNYTKEDIDDTIQGKLECLQKVDEIFSCVSGEENDILIYLV